VTDDDLEELADYTSVDQLVTGEAVALELPAASVGVRAASGLIDVAVEGGLLLVGLLVGSLLAVDAATAGVVSVVAVAIVLVIGPATLETLTSGRTLGKLVLGLRTVRDDAGPISFHHAFVRHLIAVVEVWVFSGVPALVSALVSPKGKRLGDYLAGTYVVRDRVPLRLPQPVAMPPYLAAWAAGADIAPFPDALAVSMRQLVGRAATLGPAARRHLVEQTVAQAWPLVSPAPPPGTHPEDFLAAVAAERRRRDEQRLWREAEQRWRLTQRAR
jgi:uncharacterized RDD family membrane protein YckC